MKKKINNIFLALRSFGTHINDLRVFSKCKQIASFVYINKTLTNNQFKKLAK